MLSELGITRSLHEALRKSLNTPNTGDDPAEIVEQALRTSLLQAQFDTIPMDDFVAMIEMQDDEGLLVNYSDRTKPAERVAATVHALLTGMASMGRRDHFHSFIQELPPGDPSDEESPISSKVVDRLRKAVDHERQLSPTNKTVINFLAGIVDEISARKAIVINTQPTFTYKGSAS